VNSVDAKADLRRICAGMNREIILEIFTVGVQDPINARIQFLASKTGISRDLLLAQLSRLMGAVSKSIARRETRLPLHGGLGSSPLQPNRRSGCSLELEARIVNEHLCTVRAREKPGFVWRLASIRLELGRGASQRSNTEQEQGNTRFYLQATSISLHWGYLDPQ
jgi:hypothetical protein